MQNTRDLMDFGIRELHLSAKLLLVLKTEKDHTIRLGDAVTPEFNPNSGLVFLVDQDFNVAMLKGEYLEDWHICPECGCEGFLEDVAQGKQCCKQYASEQQAL